MELAEKKISGILLALVILLHIKRDGNHSII